MTHVAKVIELIGASDKGWCIHFNPCFGVDKIENVISFRKGSKNNIKAEIGKG
jgi:hypothetical protein